MERFRPVAVALALALVQDGKRRLLVPRRWTFLKNPMPKSLLPNGECFETEIGAEFVFDVAIQAPLAGLIVAYRGTREPTTTIRTRAGTGTSTGAVRGRAGGPGDGRSGSRCIPNYVRKENPFHP